MKQTIVSLRLLFAAALLLPVFAACDDFDGDDSFALDQVGPVITAGGEPDGGASGDRFDETPDNPFVSVAQAPVSTFSVDADGASMAVVRKYLNMGLSVNPWSVRIEEFLNYFPFDYAEPADDHAVAINAEVGACPWNADHRLLRLGIKGRSLAADEMPRANFVFLIDVSGSMAGDDRIDLLKAGLSSLVYQLNPDDRISIITYSGQVKKLLESTPVRQADTIRDAIRRLRAEGYTNGGDALRMAYEEALVNYDPRANNRVILGTDGDFNVGLTSTQAIVEMVESYARKGIYMTCLGVGTGNLNDAMMERMTNAGNGTYYYLDSEDELTKIFVTERERFVSVANDAKCQVTFDSHHVAQYRLIGYENRLLNETDFDDDAKDAGEIGAGQTITALYELVPAADETEADEALPLATFDFRYKKALGDASLHLQCTLPGELAHATAYPASANLDFAAGVAALGMVLRKSPYKGTATLDMASRLVEGSLAFDPHGYRAGLLKLIDQAARQQGR